MKKITSGKDIRIGVSGDAGSFSEEAAWLYARQAGIKPKLSYLIDMEGVLGALTKRKIDLGIFPVVNSRGGLVQGAFEAMGRHRFSLVDEIWLDVKQNLMCRQEIGKQQIKIIASHPQALSQCQRHIQKNYPKAELREWKDTARAARDLKAGRLNKFAAVIGPAASARIYGLKVIGANIQDSRPNLTTFIVVKK